MLRRAVLASVVASLALATPARAFADETVRACIDQSTAAQGQRDAGKLLAARRSMIACARDECPTIVRAQCARWLAQLEPTVPSVVVRAQDADGADVMDARVLVDERPVRLDGRPVPLDPGPHAVTAVRADGARAEERVLLVVGERARVVTVRFPGGAPAPGTAVAGATTTSRRVPAGAWLLGGLGVAMLGAGAYFLAAASDQLNHLKATCSPDCTSAATQPGRTDAALADTLLPAGGAAVATAVVWALVFPSVASDTSARLAVAPIARGAVSTITLPW